MDEVWQLINRKYIDSTFNGHDWAAIRQQYVNRSYNSLDEVYTAIQDMLAQLEDPYTRFMDPQSFRSMQVDPEGKIGVIGLQITQDETTQETVVVSSILERPALEAGIVAGDVLLSIDGISTQEMTITEVADHLRGTVGSTATLVIRRDQQEQTFEIPREVITVHPVRYQIEETPAGQIGYIQLTQFSAQAPAEMRQAIDALEPQVNGYILDLRSNHGGLLYGAIEVAQMWLSEGIIVSFMERDGEINRQQSTQDNLSDKPLTVLIDEGTASGGEILAAALQDNQRAMLVGTQTRGYNSIQSVRGLPDGSGIAVTVANWITPSGENISSTGLVPDVTVALTTEQQQILVRNRTLIGTSADPQFAQAVELLEQEI
ncbi:MAG: S41 family peptidase [Cyanobacteria bacterium P01_G01_bin.38]